MVLYPAIFARLYPDQDICKQFQAVQLQPFIQPCGKGNAAGGFLLAGPQVR